MLQKKFEIVVRAIIMKGESEVLLVKRAKSPQKGKWALPGGKVEFGENHTEAIKREIREELDLDFAPNSSFIVDDYESVQGTHCLVIFFTGKSSGFPKLKSDEVRDCKYFSKLTVKKSVSVGFNHKEVLLEKVLH